MEQSTPTIIAEYYPTIPRQSITDTCTHKIRLAELRTLGTDFAVIASTIADATMQQQNMEGLYRCVYPEGVTGKLAAFRDGSGYTGTIMNHGSIQAQARWVPAEGEAIAMGVDPVSLAIAVALMNINKKLDMIAQTQQDILQFLQQDKESKLEGAVNSLSDIMANYRYQSGNAVWRGSQLTVVSSIKGTAEHNIIFYRKGMKADLEKQDLFHSAQKAEKMKQSLQQKIKYYQLSVYLYAYSSFLEVLLAGNYEKDFLSHIANKLQEYALQYRVDYTDCYNQLESYNRTAVESKALEWGGTVGKKAGSLISKIPVISKGSVDEALVSVGEKLAGLGEKKKMKFLTGFEKNRDAGIQLFADNIEMINHLTNKPIELLFDKENVYFCDA